MDERLATLARRIKGPPLLPPGDGSPLGEGEGDPARLLPHRAPLLLLDAIVAVDREQARLRARRLVDPADPVFAGHFPGQPIYPGVLLVEMMGQAALATQPLLRPTGGPARARFTRIRDAAFLQPVHPGDELDVHAEAIDDGLVVTALGQVWRGGCLCAYAISEAWLDG